jgi:hypothetical protein
VKVFGGQVEKATGLAISHQAQGFDDLRGVPLTGRELLALTGAYAGRLPPWLADRLDWRLDRLSGGQLQFLRLWACLTPRPISCCSTSPATISTGPAWTIWPTGSAGRHADQGIVIVSHDLP